jgi:hypothetical protein
MEGQHMSKIDSVWTAGGVEWDTSFKDFFFHKEINVQSIRTGDKPPYIVVSLHREGSNLMGELGTVHATLVTEANQITGDETEEELYKKIEDNDARVLYAGPLEKAEGFAQGIVDGLQLGAGLALATPARR